ncbi:MAG: hypothetical protein H6766_07880 [Candidatus Peribacteria bacterium]|nr:MAG: hypothetical protein H6766_07880 [Candidatus Peribacteria bacterium]
MRLSQLIRDRKINTETIKPEQYERVQTSHTILTQSLSTQTSDTIKDATQQNYLAHIANLFGSMGQDMDVNQSTISYDATQGLTIPFGIDGYEFHHPITIGEQLTGPKIFDRKDNQVDGNEITDTLHGVSLPTMGSIISTMSLADITDTNNYQDYQKSLESFATQQKSTLENDTASQKVSIQRYATELKAHLQGRQFATEFNTFNQTQNTANDYNDRPDQNNEQYQETYNLIDRTTESNSTTENKQLAQDLATLGSLPQRIKNIAQTSNDIDLSKSSDPWFQYLNMDNQYPNRSHELLSKFQKIGDKSPMDSKDLSLFVEYAQHIIDTKNPDITFDYYCKNIAKQQLSPHTQQLYSTDIRQAMETQSDQQDQADLASLDEQLEKVPEFFT